MKKEGRETDGTFRDRVQPRRRTKTNSAPIKEHLCNPPILQYPNFLKPSNITTDASGYAIGGILSQGEIGRDLPIALYLKSFTWSRAFL